MNDFLNLDQLLGTRVSEDAVRNLWNAGADASPIATWACPLTWLDEFHDDIKRIDIPTLILHGDDDQIVPIQASALKSSKIVVNSTLKIYPGAPHGLTGAHEQESSSIPGREIVQVRTEIPVGVESGWHIHPGEEVGYILAGTVQMMIRDQQTLTLQAGDGFLIPPRTPHNATDTGPDTGMMLSTYIVETGQPLATFVR